VFVCSQALTTNQLLRSVRRYFVLKGETKRVEKKEQKTFQQTKQIKYQL